MPHYLNQKTGKLSFKPYEQHGNYTNEKIAQSVNQKRIKPIKNTFSSDNIEVRNALNALGFENSDIGYDGTNVTYKGKSIVAPTRNNDGTTKTDTKGLIDGVNTYHKNQGSDDYIVDVTSYTASNSHLPNAVKYHENGSVTVGGIPIENVVIIDGNSYAPQSAVKAAVDKFKQQSGAYTQTELVKKYLSDTQSNAEKYMDNIINYAPFVYDPATDPVYKAYAQMYTNNANTAYENTLHLNNARTGGYTNSAAVTAASQAYYNHISALDNVIPHLANDAYKRYTDNYDIIWDKLRAYGTPAERNNLIINANNADSSAITKALNADYDRDTDIKEFEYKAAMDAWERENIDIPQNLLNMQTYNYNQALNPIIIDQELERLKQLQLNNMQLSKMYGLYY